MKYNNNVLELVGGTPLVRINHLARGLNPLILAKMESYNPGGSVKDRIGSAMIDRAEKLGELKPGGTVVEATSGNTGIGLALACAIRGYRSVFVMTDKCSQEKVHYLKALGADVIVVPAATKSDSPDHYVNLARRIAAETPNSILTNQYGNPANPEAHYRTTGPEIWEATEGKVTHFIAGMGTGGTISGTGRYLKERNPDIRIIGADPYGSVFKAFKETGKLPGSTPYLVEGVGQDMIPDNVHLKYVDEVVNVTDRDSFNTARRLGREEGIFCGGSTGTNAWVALNIAERLGVDDVVVFIVCDTGERYLTKFLSDEWMKEKRLLGEEKMTLGLLNDVKVRSGKLPLISVSPQTLIGEMLETMEEHGISQLPVIEDGQSVGSIREHHVMSQLLDDRALLLEPVTRVMDRSFPVVNETVDVSRARQYLKEAPALLIEEYGRIIGIITRYDVLDITS